MSDFDGVPTWSVREAWDAFHQWVAEHVDEVGDLELEEQIEAYHRAWMRKQN